MMNIGIFSGSFNPIHIGHIILANDVIEYTDIDEVWFLVTPHNPLKNEASLLDEMERLKMVELATKPYNRMKVSDFEFDLPRPSYTVDTLKALHKKYPDHNFTLIIGADNWSHIETWKDYKEIISNFNLLIYPRLDYRVTIPQKLRNTVKLLDSPIIEISSTSIREGLREHKNVRPFLPVETHDYIVNNQLYCE